MSALVERQFSFALTNNGNGQDSFTIELLESGVPEEVVGHADDVHADPEQGRDPYATIHGVCPSKLLRRRKRFPAHGVREQSDER